MYIITDSILRSVSFLLSKHNYALDPSMLDTYLTVIDIRYAYDIITTYY